MLVLVKEKKWMREPVANVDFSDFSVILLNDSLVEDGTLVPDIRGVANVDFIVYGKVFPPVPVERMRPQRSDLVVLVKRTKKI